MTLNKGSGQLNYSGHAIDDFPYYTFRFMPLLRNLWGTDRINYKGVNEEQTLVIRITSKELALFKHKILGLPFGKKSAITIPAYFLQDVDMTRVVLRGLFDGDGSLSFKSKDGLAHTYPVISYSSISEPLMRQLQEQLRRLEFVIPQKLWKRDNGTCYLAINGNANYERWMNTIGFNNPKHLTKVVLYERYGEVPPATDLVERVKLIRGTIVLSEFYSVEKLRLNNNRITEKKVLRELAKGENYINELGRLTHLEKRCVASALRRLTTMGLVEFVEERSRINKRYYRITQWGVNKLSRADGIITRLREGFHLAV